MCVQVWSGIVGVRRSDDIAMRFIVLPWCVGWAVVLVVVRVCVSACACACACAYGVGAWVYSVCAWVRSAAKGDSKDQAAARTAEERATWSLLALTTIV